MRSSIQAELFQITTELLLYYHFDINYKSLAELTSGLTGADIANVVNQAKITAIQRKHEKIQLDDIEETRLDGVTDHNIGDYVKAAEKHFADRKVVL